MATTHLAYEKDYYGWLKESAQLLKRGKFSEIDIDHLVEELEGMSRSERYELISRLSVLIAHLLKWEFQAARRSPSWRGTIKEQRYRIKKRLQESPSLKHEIDETLKEAYHLGVIHAAKETKIIEEDFPRKNPYSIKELLNDEFFPGGDE